MAEIIARRTFTTSYIILDSIFLVLFLILLLWQKKRITAIVGIVMGIVYFIVDYGIFHLLLGTRSITGGGMFPVLLWMSMSYGFTNFVWIWLWLRRDEHLFSWSLLILLWWFCCPMLASFIPGTEITILEPAREEGIPYPDTLASRNRHTCPGWVGALTAYRRCQKRRVVLLRFDEDACHKFPAGDESRSPIQLFHLHCNHFEVQGGAGKTSRSAVFQGPYSREQWRKSRAFLIAVERKRTTQHNMVNQKGMLLYIDKAVFPSVPWEIGMKREAYRVQV